MGAALRQVLEQRVGPVGLALSEQAAVQALKKQAFTAQVCAELESAEEAEKAAMAEQMMHEDAGHIGHRL